MANYSGMQMPQLYQIATKETDNVASLQAGIELWNAFLEVLGISHRGLSGANDKLSAEWLDRFYEDAMNKPVQAGLTSFAKSEQTVSGSNVQQVLADLIGQIGETATTVTTLHAEWRKLQKELMTLLAAAGDGTSTGTARIAEIVNQMQVLTDQAVAQVEATATAYGISTGSATAAGSGLDWTGPTSAQAAGGVSGTATAGPRPPLTVTSFAPTSGDAGAAAQADQLTQAQLDAAREAAEAGSGAGASTGDTGLASGVATAPPPATTIPPVSTPPVTPSAPVGTPPVGMPLGGAVPVTRTGGRVGGPIPVAAAVGRQAGATSIPPAAKVTGGITSASVGQAPVLPAESTGGGRTSSRGASGMPMGAVPPMLASPLAGDRLQSLIRRLKPVVTQHGRPAGERAAGVPNALRGRTGRPDDEFAMSNGQRSRRSRKETDDAPETVELLDEELWRVEQTQTGTAARTAG